MAVISLMVREVTSSLCWVQEPGPVSVLSSGHLQTTNARPVASSKQRGVISRSVMGIQNCWLFLYSCQPDDWRLRVCVGSL